MKHRKIYAFLLLTLLAFCMISCSKDENFPASDTLQLRSPYDMQWRFVGFGPGSNASDIFSAIPVQSAPTTSYLLILGKDNTFEGTSSTNDIKGNYIIDINRGTLSFGEIVMTERTETGDGQKYIQCLQNVYSYDVYENRLKLYYKSDEKKYLLYEKL